MVLGRTSIIATGTGSGSSSSSRPGHRRATGTRPRPPGTQLASAPRGPTPRSATKTAPGSTAGHTSAKTRKKDTLTCWHAQYTHRYIYQTRPVFYVVDEEIAASSLTSCLSLQPLSPVERLLHHTATHVISRTADEDSSSLAALSSNSGGLALHSHDSTHLQNKIKFLPRGRLSASHIFSYFIFSTLISCPTPTFQYAE